MKVWTNNKFEGHYPVGTAAVVVADSARLAANMLNAELGGQGLPQSAVAGDFVELKTTIAQCRVLCNGDY